MKNAFFWENNNYLLKFIEIENEAVLFILWYISDTCTCMPSLSSTYYSNTSGVKDEFFMDFNSWSI